MRFRILVFLLIAVLALGASAKSVCEFNAKPHLISGSNPDDYRCIKLRAAVGETHWQYYLGLILTGKVNGPENIPEGLSVLKNLVMRNTRHYTADAMRAIGWAYMRPGAYQDYELAYQWFFVACQEPPFNEGKCGILPDKKLNAVITPERMRELEKSASSLLKNR